MDREDTNANMAGATKMLGAKAEKLKKDIEDLEISLICAKQERSTKEMQIKLLQGKMVQQHEFIARFTQ